MKTDEFEQITRIVNSRDPRHAPNLKAFLRKWIRKSLGLGVPSLVHNTDGLPYVGVFYDGDFIGAQLGQINGNGARTKTWCFPRAGKWKVDKTFWNRYETFGVCAYDADHSWYPERWATPPEGRTRRCIYCGRKERLTIERKVITREVWKEAARS